MLCDTERVSYYNDLYSRIGCLMSSTDHSLRLPSYSDFVESMASLFLPGSVSELHGLLCGYLCAGATEQGGTYIRALVSKKETSKEALLALFSLYSISQQQMNQLDLSFALLLPNDEEPLPDRARAFSEWCDGFIHGLVAAGIEMDHLQEEDAQDALQHLTEFAEMDCESLDTDNEEDERALMEITEYARMAVIRLHGDLMQNQQHEKTH